MDYKKIYADICDRGKCDRGIDYIERHHIVPKCMDGTDDTTNIACLTAKEHYIAHWLLYKMYPNNWKIAHTFLWMATENKNNGRRITSIQYERAKKAMSVSCSERIKDIGNPMWSESAKSKISKRMKGNKNPAKTHPTTHNSYLLKNGFMEGPAKGGKWYNNGTKSKYFKSNDVIPAEWKEGMASYADRGKWITNGIENKKLKNDEDMPAGFKYGKKK